MLLLERVGKQFYIMDGSTRYRTQVSKDFKSGYMMEQAPFTKWFA